MTLKEQKDNFILITKRILKSDLSRVPQTLIQYKRDVITGYNIFIEYCQRIDQDTLSQQQKDNFIEELNTINKKFEECLIKLNCNYNLSAHLLDLADPNTIYIIDLEPTVVVEEQASPPVSPEIPHQEEQPIMALTNPEFLKIASSHINKVYSGDPLALTSFTDSIRLLESIATTDGLRTFLISFIKTKLDGRAREYITATHTTIDSIINALQSNIKPDNSKVLAGRILSLRLNLNNQADFAEKAETLAEAFRRSLVIEGISNDKAIEMSIEKTVDLCRANTRTDLVKSILEATAFATPKEVVAKMLVQTEKAKHEHQVLSFTKTNAKGSSNQKKLPQNQQNNGNSNSNSNRNTNPRNSQNRAFNNNQNQSNNRSQNGNFRAPNNRNNGSFHNNGNGNRYVRVFTQSGNGQGPQALTMGEPTQPQFHDQHQTTPSHTHQRY